MAQNYVLLERIELNASAASVTFSNIPQSGYTDLKIVYSARDGRAENSDDFKVTINNNTSATYSNKRLYGTGSGTGSDGGSGTGLGNAYSGVLNANNSTANTYSNGEFYFPNYLSSTAKSWSGDGVTENNATGASVTLSANLCSDTNPISIIKLEGYNSGTLNANSTFSLYGLAAVGTTPAIAPKASGGNTIATDGTYWYHAFLTSGTFTPLAGITADVLVVAGGGAGASRGNRGGGGGGAGGLLGFSAQTLSLSTSYTITVGAGGAAVANGSLGNNGSNSQFGVLTAAVGGGGGNGGAVTSAGASGGSGGGAYIATDNSEGTGGAATPSGQGYAGGNSSVFSTASAPNYFFGGAGGGAGQVGAKGVYNSSTGTNGGVGATYNTSIGGTAGPYAFINAMGAATSTGQLVSSNYYYAGGGGGGSGQYGGSSGPNSNGGYGGGGAGTGSNSSGVNGTSGTANMGGGGGGANAGVGGAGGSGIVIIRYAMA